MKTIPSKQPSGTNLPPKRPPALKLLREPRHYAMPSNPDREAEVFAVGILVNQGLSTGAISTFLKMGTAKVRHLRLIAKRLIYGVDFTKASSELVVAKAMQLANRSDVLDLLRRLPGGQRLRNYKGVVSGSVRPLEPFDLNEFNARLKVFCAEARPHLAHALITARITLLTYGTTLRRAFERTNFKSLGSHLAVYPACCDPWEYHHEDWASTRLAHWVTELQGRPTGKHPSLAGLLPIISPSFRLEARRALSKYMQSAPDYISIYGPDGLAKQANCLITSIGRSEEPWMMGDDYFVKTVGIDRNELHSLIVAEMGSVPLPRHDLTPEQKARFEEINAARLGLRLEHIEAIARRGACGQGPGVIVLALGANKARCLLELVKRGLVNVAIIDNSLEAKLRELLEQELKHNG